MGHSQGHDEQRNTVSAMHGEGEQIGGSGGSLFAPGPGADWSGIPEALWPAIDGSEVEQQFRRMAHGCADRLDRGLGHAKEIRRCEVLRRLWEATFEEAHKRASRRSWRFLTQEVLRSIVHGGCDAQASRNACANIVDAASQETAEVLLRAMRDYAAIAGPSQGSRPSKQRGEQPRDIVCDVSHETPPQERRHCDSCREAAVPCVWEEVVSERFVQHLSHSTAEIWRSVPYSRKAWVRMESDLPRHDASRADRLRCSGNGVVALQGAVAFVELVRRALKCG